MNKHEVKILIVDDEAIVRESLKGWFEEDGFTVDTAENAIDALKKLNEVRWDIYFLDIKMPGMDGMELHRRIKKIDAEAVVIIITAYASVDTAVQALKEGAFDYITKPFDPDSLSHIIRNAEKQRRLSIENIELKDNLESLTSPPTIIGISEHIQDVKNSISTVAKTDTTVLIRGESGTGKELVAQAIHRQSNRRFLPLVSVNCGALAETLLESELFGHEKGAFTGAIYRRKGKLEIANGGTLFLDEIGSISAKTQIDLLRAIELKEFTRLGSNESIKSNFRVISATNSDLEEAVKNGSFREDLYYRLHIYVIYLKPIRERVEDIPELVQYFINNFRTKMGKQIEGIENSAMDMLINYSWPGNVRELENSLERAMVTAKGRILRKEDFLLNLSNEKLEQGFSSSLAEVEKIHILKILEKNNWNVSLASKLLKVDRTTLYKKLKRYGIERPKNA